MRSNADSTASASHPLRNASRRAFDRAARAARSGPYQCQLCPRPPPRPFALIPARFCDCVPATTCGRPAMLVAARTQIGLSHTSWIANSESASGRPSSSINAYRCGRTTRCRPSRTSQKAGKVHVFDSCSIPSPLAAVEELGASHGDGRVRDRPRKLRASMNDTTIRRMHEYIQAAAALGTNETENEPVVTRYRLARI